jgi:4-diphosphocytidyl-2-C-methyl-D-erythritol kinase
VKPAPTGGRSSPRSRPHGATGLPLRASAPAKINLGLFVGPLGESGRHELVSVMQSISLADELVLEEASAGAVDDEVDAPGVPGEASDNLVARALRGFRELTGWEAPPLRVVVTKRIPVAAGLGGGSADAAALLRLAARAASVPVDAPAMLELAARLGSDVPAQLRPGRWLVFATGEGLQDLPAPDPPPGVLVVALPAELSTAAVYAEADRLRAPRSAEELAELRAILAAAPLKAGLPPPELLANDLEPAARALCPAIEEAMRCVAATGAEAVLVSGSGPTLVGLFAGADGPRRAVSAAERLAAGGGGAGERPETLDPAAAVPVDAAFGEPGPVVAP